MSSVPAPSPLVRARKNEMRRVVVGSVLLGALGLATLYGVTRPAFTSAVSRVSAAVGSGLDAERDDDFVASLPFAKGVHAGLPVYGFTEDAAAHPVGHVVDVTPNLVIAEDGNQAVKMRGVRVRIRFAPYQSAQGPWRLEGFRPSRKLSEAFKLAVPEEAAREFAAFAAERMKLTWTEAILPEAEKQLPSFLKRISPTEDTEAKALFQRIGKTLFARLEPLLDDLANHVTKRIKKKFDLLDRLGLLVKVVSGDAKGLKDEVIPVARDASLEWWSQNQKRVFSEVGDGLGEHGSELQAWVTGELWHAFRDELMEPILERHGKRLEEDGQVLMRRAADTFIESPHGGFRIRFTSMLRHNLLNKKTALLLLHYEGEPVEKRFPEPSSNAATATPETK